MEIKNVSIMNNNTVMQWALYVKTYKKNFIVMLIAIYIQLCSLTISKFRFVTKNLDLAAFFGKICQKVTAHKINFNKAWKNEQQTSYNIVSAILKLKCFCSDLRPTVYAYATRPIRKGDEICDAYSGVFSIADKEERSLVHQRYHFQVRVNIQF